MGNIIVNFGEIIMQKVKMSTAELLSVSQLTARQVHCHMEQGNQRATYPEDMIHSRGLGVSLTLTSSVIEGPTCQWSYMALPTSCTPQVQFLT